MPKSVFLINLFNIYIEKKLNIKGLKGKIIDSYALNNIDNDYYLIRTIQY